MEELKELENRSISIIREAVSQFKNPAMLWSAGKDSTALLWMARKAFFGKIPFPVIHIDTGCKFPEMYSFRDKLAKEWGINLIISKNEAALKNKVSPETCDRLECCTKLKTDALKQCIDENKFDAIFLAIRRDEHGVRAKERIFSPRKSDFKWDYKNQPPEMWDLYKNMSKEGTHFRIHPILHWTEYNVWQYTKQEGIPVNPLYFAKNGRRYRSLGCMCCTSPIDSNADDIGKIIKELSVTKTPERAGRAQDKGKSYAMQKLRALGYM
jgi:sulfate adenylyltransferase subunit 2